MREQRLVFGEDADLYDAARPSYPDELVDDVVGMVGPGARVLDIGCGTGKATVLLAVRGLKGVGVEADPSMAERARRNLEPFPEWRICVSDFETWQPPEGLDGFDLVCSAQAWHWLDPAVRLHKAHDLLRPSGWLALWWNWNRPAGDASTDEADVAEQISEIYSQVAPSIAEMAGMGPRGKPPSEKVPAGLSFGEPVRTAYPWTKEYTPETWVALLRTQSDHRLLPPAQLDELTERVQRLLMDRGGVYRHHYECWLWAVQRA